MSEIQRVAVLGAGVIGASWAALFLAAGRDVSVYDPQPDAEDRVRAAIDSAWPTLQALGAVHAHTEGSLSFYRQASEAVLGCQFVQESVPEQLPIKHGLYQQIESALDGDCIVASSASGLMLAQMQRGWRSPARFILAHPFNPPHLIPLVELFGNDKTDPRALEVAEGFYQALGKVTIRLQREVPAHVANRLQAALWREAIYLVQSGVASAEDVDKAVWAGPGLRWAAMGPTQLFHLGAGEGGLAEFCQRYRPSFERWWADLGQADLSPEAAQVLIDAMQAKTAIQGLAGACAERDQLIVAMLKATRAVRGETP